MATAEPLLLLLLLFILWCRVLLLLLLLLLFILWCRVLLVVVMRQPRPLCHRTVANVDTRPHRLAQPFHAVLLVLLVLLLKGKGVG